MSKENAVSMNEILDLFTAEQVKLDKTDQAYLVKKTGAIKEASPLSGRKSIQAIRKKAKKLGVRLLTKDVNELQEQLEAMAWEFEQKHIVTSMRYALSAEGDAIHVDLKNDEGQIIELKANSVKILDSEPSTNDEVYFQRPDFMQEMVTPELDQENTISGIKKLHPFINTDTNTFFLLIAYMTYLISHPKACGLPYPILVIQGEKGSGKSFFCNNVIRALLDPSSLTALPMTSKQDDLVLQLNSMFLVVFDNLRTLTKAQSDLLCSIATKASTAKRTLYKTSELTSFELHSPMVLNGIHDFIKESDLASRCLKVDLKPMPNDKRKAEKELKAELEAVLPEILGSLLTLSSKALAVEGEVEVEYKPRMMDFGNWLAALEKVWGWEAGKLQKQYVANVKNIMASGTADDSLTIALQKFIQKQAGNKVWKSTPSGLLETLQQYENQMYLPRGAAALTSKMKAQESSLNANGIYFKMGRGSERFVMVAAKPFS
jgi:hypothetical protein